MKKNLLAVAIIATLASCSNDEFEVGNTSANQIKFNTLNDKVTRSANDANANYRVLAKTSLSGETAWYIDEVIDGTNAIVSGNSYFYPSSGSVDFYAYAPAASSNIVATTTYPNASIAYTVPTSANEDFTIATPVLAMTTGVVPLQFKHMLAKLDFAAVLSQDLIDAGYTVTFGSTDVGAIKNAATINVMAATPAWTSLLATTTTYTGFKTYNVMPQSALGLTVQLKNVVITKGGAEVFSGDLLAHPIATGEIGAPTSDEFVMGYKYVITFTITSGGSDGGGNPIFGDEITFSSTVDTWTNATGTITQP